MNKADLSITTWRKSSYSGGNAECVEAAAANALIGVRDTKDRALGHITITAESWQRLVTDIRL